jgi:1,4-dihydroxy-6-naphthoate synthase
VLSHAQELSREVVKGHIDLYVNEFTLDIGKTGYEAVATLLSRASEAGLAPKVDIKALY